jgi:pimeloyl-ACP methyl ester carboxylesterase
MLEQAPSTNAATRAGATIAAAISYQVIERPAALPDRFVAPSGIELQFLAITTIDGVTNTAALVQPRGRAIEDTTLLIHVHGSGGNFHGLPHGAQLMPLADQGYAGLAINTRQHDEAMNTDNFFAVRHDLAAAVAVARALGYRRVVLRGHSLGTVQVLYHAATEWSADITGVILTGPFADLPWKTQIILVHDEVLYRQLADEALAAVHAGQPEAVLTTEMPYTRGHRSAVTAQHFLTYRWHEEAAASSVEWIERVPVPILLVRDGNDQVILPFELHQLHAAAIGPGALSPDVESVLIPDAHPDDGHRFPNTIPELNDVMVQWLDRHGL